MQRSCAILLFLLTLTVQAEDLLQYGGTVRIDPAASSIAAEITVAVPTEIDIPTEFLLNGQFAIQSITGAGVTNFEVTPMAPGADWNRVSLQRKIDADQASRVIKFVYAGKPKFPENGINQISEDWIELSVDTAWHPVVAAIDHQLQVDLNIQLPGTWAVVSSAESEPREDGFRLVNNIPQSDIAFIAAKQLDVYRVPGFELFHDEQSQATITTVLDAARRCRWYLNTWFGQSDPLPDASMVITDRKEGGYARKNFIALTRVANRTAEDLTGFLCHELAHYWSSGAKPLTVDNWLNESFAVYVSARATRAFFGESAWESRLEDWTERSEGQGSIWTADDQSRRSFEVNYKKGPLILSQLEQEIGSVAFERLLKRYMTDPIDTTPALLDVLEEEAGPSARDWLVSRLGE